MPCYDVKCINDHVRMVYHHHPDDRHLKPHLCPECNNTQAFIISRPGSYRYFSEKSPRLLTNLGHEPVEIRSHAQHAAELKKRGLAWATPRRGMPGSWS